MPAGTLGPKGGWIVRSHNGWRGERNIFYTRFKNLEGSPKGKAQRGQYLLALDLGCTKSDHYNCRKNTIEVNLKPNLPWNYCFLSQKIKLAMELRISSIKFGALNAFSIYLPV